MKNGRYESSARSPARSHYQTSRDFSSHGSRYTSSSKSYSHTSTLRGLFEKTFSRFFGGSLTRKQILCVLFVGLLENFPSLTKLTADFSGFSCLFDFVINQFLISRIFFNYCNERKYYHMIFIRTYVSFD